MTETPTRSSNRKRTARSSARRPSGRSVRLRTVLIGAGAVLVVLGIIAVAWLSPLLSVRMVEVVGADTIPQEDFPFLAQAALEGRIDLARFVTSTIPLEEVPERLPRIGEGGEIRTVAVM